MAHDRWLKSDIQPFFQRYGWMCRVESAKRIWDPITKRWRHLSGAEKAEPDMMAIRGTRGIFIEAKCFNGVAWETRNWGLEQRKWTEDKIESGESVWFALMGGAHPPNYNPNKYCPRRFWLVYGLSMLALVRKVESIQYTIPYQLNGNENRYAKGIIAKRLCLVEALEDYEVPYADGQWKLQEYHPFFRGYYGGMRHAQRS